MPSVFEREKKVRKKITAIFLAIVMVFMFVACSKPTGDPVLSDSSIEGKEEASDTNTPAPGEDFENMSSMEKIAFHWDYVLTGNDDNMTNKAAKAKAVSVGNAGMDLWKSMNMGESAETLWGDASKLSEGSLSTFYGNLYTMTLAWGTKGSLFYHKEALKDAVIFGLDWMYDNLYGEQVIKEGTYGNWWQWKIGGPRELVRILIVLKDELSEEQICKYLKPVDHLLPNVSYTGANRVWIGYIVIAASLLENDEARLAQAVKALDEVYDYVTIGDGFYTDGSFIQHNRQAYNGGYATAMVNYVSELAYILQGSNYQISDAQANRIGEWVKNSLEPFMVDGLMMSFIRGRELTRTMSEFERGVTVIEAMLKASLAVDKENAESIRRTIKYYCTVNADYDYTLDMPIHLSPVLQELIDDNSIEPRSDYTMARVFHSMDRLLQQNGTYTLGVCMSSSRIYKYEAINNENTEGWYMRWKTKISKATYDTLKTAGATIKIGTLITPTQYVQTANAFTKEALDAAKEANGWDIAYLDVTATDGQWFNSDRKDTDDYIFAGSIGEIMPEHYELQYSAVGYMEIIFADGKTVTLYSEYVEKDHARTVAQVAAAALADENNGLNDTQIAEIQKFISKENT